MESRGDEPPPSIVTEDELADTINERLAEIAAGRANLLDAKKALARGRSKLRRRRRA